MILNFFLDAMGLAATSNVVQDYCKCVQILKNNCHLTPYFKETPLHNYAQNNELKFSIAYQFLYNIQNNLNVYLDHILYSKSLNNMSLCILHFLPKSSNFFKSI